MEQSSCDTTAIDDIKRSVLEVIQEDVLGSEFSIAIFSAAILSYRKSTCLKPLPSFSTEVDNEKQLEELVTMFQSVPPLKEIPHTVLSEEIWKLLYWILQNKKVKAKSCGKDMLKKIFSKTGESSFPLQPCQVFEICYNTKASERFDELKSVHGLKYGYHGSRLDNFYSIISNGLQVHMMKNGLFGEGVYLSDDLSVTMPYTKSGVIWDHSELGEQVSCVAFCELIDHPGVKCQVDNDISKKRAKAKNSESGDVPERYFVVTSSELVRVKYILLFSKKKADKRATKRKPNVCSRYPVLTILILYLIFLLLMGVWKSKWFKTLHRKYFQRTGDDYDDIF